MVRPPDAPFDGETDYPAPFEDRCPTDAEATALALDSGAVIQAKIAAEAAAEEELPKRKPAEVAHGRAGRTAYPRDAVSRKRGDDAAADGDESRSDQEPDVTAQDVEEAFKDNIHGLRLVRDFWTGKMVGAATWDPDDSAWQIVNLETPVEREVRQASINLLTVLALQATGAAAGRPSDLDQAVAIATKFANPGSITLKLCNGLVQGVAHHCGLGFMAPALGAFVEQTLSPLVNPPSGLTRAIQDLQVLDVTVDAATGRLTPAVYDFVIAELGGVLRDKTRGISQAELDEIDAAVRRR